LIYGEGGETIFMGCYEGYICWEVGVEGLLGGGEFGRGEVNELDVAW
jgi:hypothetical protein